MIEYKKIETDYKDEVVLELLFDKKNGNYWCKVFDWFRWYKPQDGGVQFIWDSFFANNKYIQCIYMYKEMIKKILFLYKYYHDPEFHFNYNPHIINGIKQFWESNFVFTSSAFSGNTFYLEPNQLYKIFLMYGFSYKSKYKPRAYKNLGIRFMVNKFYDVETRKNGKSEFFAALAVFIQQNPFSNDASPSIFSSGADRETSKIILDKAQKMVKANSGLYTRYEAVNTVRFKTLAGGTFRDLPFNKKALEGQEPSFGVATEYHLHDTDLMVESIESAKAVGRPNSLLVFDTTKGLGINGVAFNREFRYKDLLDKQLGNPDLIVASNIATFIAEMDEQDRYEEFLNPWETNIFRKSTPMLGLTIDLKDVQEYWEEARLNPTTRKEFLIKKAGRWIGNKSSILEIQDLKDCDNKFKGKYKLENLRKAECIIAIDLANTGDTNAVTLLFKDVVNAVEIPIFHSHIFVPKETVDIRVIKERKPYFEWMENNWVSLSGDKAVDYKDIANYIIYLLENYNVQKIVYDRWHFHMVKTYLVNYDARISEGLLEEVQNNAATLSSPLSDLLNKIWKGNMYYFGNKVFADQFLNCVIQENTTGALYFTKSKQVNRIDIFATAVMGMVHFKDIRRIGTKTNGGIMSWKF